MALPDWIKKHWKWIIATIIIPIAAIIVQLSTDSPVSINQTINTNGNNNISAQFSDSAGATININKGDPEERETQKIILQIEEENKQELKKIQVQLDAKNIDANPQFVSDLKDKIQKLEKELEKLTRTTEDKRAEEALIASKAGNYEKARELFETLRKEERRKEAAHAKTAYTWAMYILSNWIFQRL